MNRIVCIAAVATMTALAGSRAAFATDFELELGLRSFGSDHERWPQVSGKVLFGPDRWPVRPVLGGAWSEDPVFAGTIAEGRLGVASDLFRSGPSVVSGGVGAAHVDYDFGANHGAGDAGYLELGWRWERPEEVDFGAVVRWLDGPDIELRSSYDEIWSDPAAFRASLSTVSLSFVLRW